MHIVALEHIRSIRGGTKPHLMRCSDGAYYIVKFQGNPQGTRTLANDLYGTMLARRIGLPVAEGIVLDVRKDLIDLTDRMGAYFQGQPTACQPGLSFGSRYVSTGSVLENALPEVENYLPPNRLRRVTNLADFIGTLVFDIWTANRDSRQFVFTQNREEGTWTATMIDQGMCFNGESWCFCENLPGRLYFPYVAYESITGIDAFEPWLSRLEDEVNITVLQEIADEIPPEWYESDHMALRRIVKILDCRRSMVRELVWQTWEGSRPSFPNWIRGTSSAERLPLAVLFESK